MANTDLTRSIHYAIRTLLPSRPHLVGRRRFAWFLGLVLVSLMVCTLVAGMTANLGLPKVYSVAVAATWVTLLSLGTPLTFYLAHRDQRANRSRVRDWELDARRLSMERLGLDLSAGRLPVGLTIADVLSLEQACADWRTSREGLESLSWLTADMARVRENLRHRLDDAMTNVLAEAGAGDTLGPSPFLIERARNLFAEVGSEANSMAQTQAPALHLQTDQSLMMLRSTLDEMRSVREAKDDLVEILLDHMHAEGS